MKEKAERAESKRKSEGLINEEGRCKDKTVNKRTSKIKKSETKM
jgi:hypothetical protein